MQKTLYFTSPTQPHYIEINNNNDVKNEFRIHFNGENLNLFKIENYKISQFKSFNDAYTIEVNPNSSAYIEISPICGDSSVDAHVYCEIEREDKQFKESYKLILALRKEKYNKNITRYVNLDKKFKNYEKGNKSTFALLSSNPLLSGNSRLYVTAKQDMYFSLIDGISESNNSKLYNRKITKGSDYLKEISSFFKEMDKENDSFYRYHTVTDTQNVNTSTNLYTQYNDDVYMSGASYLPSKYYDEKYSIFAPLYLEDKIPSTFVIFRRKKYQDVSKDILFKDLEIVKTFDLTENSELGKFLKRTLESNDFDKPHLKTNIEKNSVVAEITGIDPKSASVNTVYEDITPFIEKESQVIDLEKHISDVYSKRSMVSHRMINLEFLFDDVEDDFNSYFGMYVDDLQLDEFSLDLSKYGTDFFKKNRINFNGSVSEIHTNSTVPLNTKFVNDNNRLFYFKNKDNYRNILQSDLNNGKLSFVLDKEINLNDFTCEDYTIDIDNSKIIEDVKPYVLLKIDNGVYPGFRLIIKESVRNYVFEVIDTTPQNISRQYQHRKIIEPVTIAADDEYLNIDSYYRLSDHVPVKLYGSGSSFIGEFPIAYSVNNGETTQVYFSDAVDVSNVEYIEFIKENEEVHHIKYHTDPNIVLSDIVDKINELSHINYQASKNNREIVICNDKNRKFTVDIDVSDSDSMLDDVQYFDSNIELNQFTVNNTTRYSNYHSFDSIDPLKSDEVLLELDDYDSSIIDNTYYSLGKQREYNISPTHKTDYTIKYFDFNKKVIKTKKDTIGKRIIKPCLLSFGIFSIYETKDFNVERVADLFDYIDEEYRLIYRNFTPDEKLVPRMMYQVDNVGSEELKLQIKVGKEDSWQHTVIKEMYISAGQSDTFSTFASDYDLNYYNENIEFRYDLIKGSGKQFKVYIKHIFEDPDVLDGDFEFPYNAFINNTLLKYIETSKNNNEIYFPYLKNSRSEYMRLQEFSNEDTNFEDILVPKYCKWGSLDSIDSKGQPMRFNFSPAFGKTGYTSYLSNFKAQSDVHSHEWFILEEVPTHLKLYEGVENQYLFTQVSKALLLDETYDYFREYFENGWPNVNRDSKYLSLAKAQNYSTLYPRKTGEYETFFKGSKYRFASDEDLTDYRFAISVSTRPKLTEANGSLIDHCEVEGVDYNCKADGIFPLIMDAIDVLETSDQSRSLNVSFIKEGTSVNIDDDEYTTVGIDSPLYTSNEFFSDLDLALDEWVSEFERIYSTENGWPNNLSLTFDEDEELSSFPVTSSYITNSQKAQYNIGDIRIGFADLKGGDIAKSYFITKNDYLDNLERMTPVILLNSRVYFRKNSDNSSNDAYSLAYVIAHELGHIFGLGHTLKADSIMNPVVKVNYNLSELDHKSTQECIELIYGKYSVDVEVTPTNDFSCSKVRNRKHDSFEFIVNKKFKTITLRMCVDIPNYLSLDSKKSYVEMYVSNSLKRIARYNNEVILEGLDLAIPPIDLSIDSLGINDNVFYATNTDFEVVNLDEMTVGHNPLNSAYRIRMLDSNKDNYQLDYFSVDYIPGTDQYKLITSFDYAGDVNKPLLYSVANGADGTENVNMPLLSSVKFKKGFSYRIKGGDAIENGNYKLTLDYLDKYSRKFDYYYSDDTTGKIFELSVGPIHKVTIGDLKIPVLRDENSEPVYKLKDSDVEGNLYRHEAKFDPLFDRITYFGIRDDYELSNLLGIDLYKCNTRILWQHPKFGNMNRLIKKTTIDPLFLDDSDIDFSLYKSKLPVFNQMRKNYISPFDKNIYKLFISNKENLNLSGFYDPLLFKSNLNSVLFNIPDVVERDLISDDVTFNVLNDELVLEVNKKNILMTILYDYILNSYSQIYNITEIELKESLEKFIINNFINLYTVSKVELYTKLNKINEYVDDGSGLKLTSGFSVDTDNNKITVKKGYNQNLSVHLKLKFKFI